MLEKDLKMIDEEIIEEIENELILLESSQEILVESIRDRTILLVDLTLGENLKILDLAKKQINEHQKLIQYYSSRFNIEEGISISQIFQLYFGPNVNTEVISMSEFGSRIIKFNNIALVVFSGSPANITDALKPVKDSSSRQHRVVYDFVSKFYDLALDLELPIFGICYGHQFLSHKYGNLVSNDGYFTADKITKMISKKILRIINKASSVQEKGFLPYYNGDLVKGFNHAHPLFESNEGQVDERNDGSIFFSTSKDRYDLNEELINCSGWNLGVQGHPEYSIFEPIFSAAWGKKDIRPLGQRSLSPEILKILAHLLNLKN